MKNKRFTIYSLYTLGVIGALFFIKSPVFSYDQFTTHPALTNEIVDFYNLSFPNQPLTAEEKQWLAQGSIDEDTMPRWINHFYDPIYNQGWTGELEGTADSSTVRSVADILLSNIPPVASKYWAQAPTLQAQYGEFRGDRTWQRAISEMVKNNNKQEAYYTLGYILHLIEDATVPDHTRNDTHAPILQFITHESGSPYEEYTKTHYYPGANLPVTAQTLYKEGTKPVLLSTLTGYFNNIANYSNHYFFSKDTIPANPLITASEQEKNLRKYRFPEVINTDGQFGFGKDEAGMNFPLVKIKEVETSPFVFKTEYLIEVIDGKILDAYFLRLSREAIVNGAGVIKLFQDEVKNEQPQNINTLPQETDGVLSVYAIVKNVQNFIGNIFAPFHPTTGTISIAASVSPNTPINLKPLINSNEITRQPPYTNIGSGSPSSGVSGASLLASSPASAGDVNQVLASNESLPALTPTQLSQLSNSVASGSLPAWALPLIITLGLGAATTLLKDRLASSPEPLTPPAPPAITVIPPDPPAVPVLPNYAKDVYYQPDVVGQYSADSRPSGDNVTWRPPNGQPGDEGRWLKTIPGFYFSNFNGTYRPITDFQSSGLDPSTIQRGQFGGDPNSHAAVTTGGAQTWEQYKANAYAMDPEIRAAVDALNTPKPVFTPDLPPADPTPFQIYFQQQKAAGRTADDILHNNPFMAQNNSQTNSTANDFAISAAFLSLPWINTLSEPQKQSVSHMLQTRQNGNNPLNETDAKNLAFATGRLSSWQQLVGVSALEAVQRVGVVVPKPAAVTTPTPSPAVTVAPASQPSLLETIVNGATKVIDFATLGFFSEAFNDIDTANKSIGAQAPSIKNTLALLSTLVTAPLKIGAAAVATAVVVTELAALAAAPLTFLPQLQRLFDPASRADQLVQDEVGEVRLGGNLTTEINNKISSQLVGRGWTVQLLQETINNPYTTRVALNKATGNLATAFYTEGGAYVVRDNVTGVIVQISNRLQSDWIPDSTIVNPYKPQ